MATAVVREGDAAVVKIKVSSDALRLADDLGDVDLRFVDDEIRLISRQIVIQETALACTDQKNGMIGSCIDGAVIGDLLARDRPRPCIVTRIVLLLPAAQGIGRRKGDAVVRCFCTRPCDGKFCLRDDKFIRKNNG